MQWGTGVLGWSPSEFWSATPIELGLAIKGWKIANGIGTHSESNNNAILSKSDVDELRELMADEDGD